MNDRPFPHRFRSPVGELIEQGEASSELDSQPVEVTHSFTFTDTSAAPAYDYLMDVLGGKQPYNRGMAQIALGLLPFQVGKRSVVAGGVNKDFAKNLEKANKRLEAARATRLHSLPAARNDGPDDAA